MLWHYYQDRLLQSLTDLVALTALLSVTPTVREAASAVVRGDQKGKQIWLLMTYILNTNWFWGDFHMCEKRCN